MLNIFNALNLPFLVFPLRAVFIQLLLLLVVIAIEAKVIHSKLGLTPKGSVQFSTLLNLVSTLGGWGLFFSLEPFIPETWRLGLINYVLFDKGFWEFMSQNFLSLTLPVGATLYVLTFALESQILNLLLVLLASKPKLEYQQAQTQYDRQQRYKASWTDRFRMNTLLIANGYSYLAVLVLLVITHGLRYE